MPYITAYVFQLVRVLGIWEAGCVHSVEAAIRPTSQFILRRHSHMNSKNSCYILQLNHSINSKWQFLDCAAIAFSEWNIYI